MPKTESFRPSEWALRDTHQLLLGAVSPRPIAFVSTLDAQGHPNLAPFSWFNVVSAKPPILVFSPARRGRDNTTKHTYDNLTQLGECTVNVVSYPMTQQMVLTSTEYPEQIDEFEKSGFTKAPSQEVKPPRVSESSVQFECRVRDIVNYAEEGGAGNIVLAEVVRVHFHTHIMGEDGRIDPYRIDPIGRLGKNFYTRARKGLFTTANPPGKDNLGFDGLPAPVRHSRILTGNELAQLARIPALPALERVHEARELFQLKSLQEQHGDNAQAFEDALHEKVRPLIAADMLEPAWAILMNGASSK